MEQMSTIVVESFTNEIITSSNFIINVNPDRVQIIKMHNLRNSYS